MKNENNIIYKLPLGGLIAAGIIVLGVIIYLNPVSEEMTCDKNLTCTIRQNFMFVIPYTKVFKLNNQETITFYKRHARRYRTHAWSLRLDPPYIVYPKYPANDNKRISPFICEWLRTHKHSYIKTREEMEAKIFARYMNNPEIGYRITSSASISELLIRFLFGAILVYALIGCYKLKKDAHDIDMGNIPKIDESKYKYLKQRMENGKDLTPIEYFCIVNYECEQEHKNEGKEDLTG